MSLSSVLSGLRRLSLNSPTSALIKTVSPNISCSSLVTSSLAQRCLLHTSPACLRIHDNRLRPFWQRRDPSSRSDRWEPRKKFSEMYEYTVRPLPNPKTGGRGPNGRIWNHKRAGGHKRNYRMIDWTRAKEDQSEDLLEKVDKILYDPNRSARIALVAGGERSVIL